MVIGSIAETLCLADASSFGHAFRRAFGMSPSDVRAATLASLGVTAHERRGLESGARSFSDCLRARIRHPDNDVPNPSLGGAEQHWDWAPRIEPRRCHGVIEP